MDRKIKKLHLLVIFIFIFCLIPSFTKQIKASPATSYTMTLNSKGRYIRTQDGYLPERSIVELKLKNPMDLFIYIEKIDEETHKDYMFIADTGNKRIIKYDPYQDEVLLTLAYSEFVTPKGVYVTKNEEIYVADAGAQAIFVFNENGDLLQKYTKPSAPTFEDSPFNPSKIGVDNRGNMFVFGEGVSHGIIHLSKSGEFLGYFTSNLVDLTFMQRLQNRIFNEEQIAKLFPRTPSTFSNVFVDQNSLVYTTTSGGDGRFAIKKHNIAGDNNFSDGVVSPSNAVDVYVDEQGIIYSGMDDGVIFVYSPQGEFIHSFGASNYNRETRRSDDIAGLFNSLSAIAVDGYGTVWALDDNKAFIQSFKPTEYTQKIYHALDLYTNREYENAIEMWREVLRLNQMSVLAHNNIGKNYLALQEYELAMEHFEIAGNRGSYSDAFWEVRNKVLQNNLTTIFIVLIIFVVTLWILKFINRRKPFFYLLKIPFRKIKQIKIIDDILYMFRVLKHPLDSFYELKKGHKGSLLGAIIIYLMFFFIFLWFTIGKGFIYQYVAVEDLDMNSIVLGYFALTILFVVCNYLVTSIKDGEGGFKQIFVFFTYSLAPMFVAFTSVTLLSYILTYNEAFFLDAIMYTAAAWAGMNIFLGVQETHNYTIRNTIKSILLTIAFMLIIVILITIIIVMWEQLINFFEEIIMEAIRNARE